MSPSLTGAVADLAADGVGSLFPNFGLRSVVETATGWFGLVIIFVYSFLIAFALPGVSEVVLLAPLDLGLSQNARYAVIILVSGVGKAVGSVFAFHIGQEAKNSGFIERKLRESRFGIMEWTEEKTLEIAQTWGYAGLAAALCVPTFPDTLSIYAFSVLEEDYVKFAVATFVGSVGRLLVTLVGVEALSTLF
ncbi:YqaA family protein [Halogeometricum pallidum]|uniref:YqaA family protein n=1 Tax=Halogeometricum pallidum TaxID=411361 RepID=UPI000677C06E|nr:VTT domain-containing protein [Halogeometricum pallidum]